ncbi:MAG: DUF362 domain-containing protein [Chloroflexi bacterium]|nr:DUF362 domain-containing protein [Chloroflexota bacterium]
MTLNRKPVVAAVKAEYDEHLFERLSKVISLAGGLEVSPSQPIVIKINLCDVRTPESGAITHPDLLDALLRYIRENVGLNPISVVESDATVILVDLAMEWLGFKPILEKWGVQWVNLVKHPTALKAVRGHHLKEVAVSRVFDDAYFISLTKLKTNSMSTITCVLKNQFGCSTIVDKKIYHPHLAEVIADLNKVMRPDFGIVDGIIGQGGPQGPAFGIPIHSQVLITGKDPVAVDSACARMMGFSPPLISHIRKAAQLGIGSMDYGLVTDGLSKTSWNYRGNQLERLIMDVGLKLQSRARRQLKTARPAVGESRSSL